MTRSRWIPILAGGLLLACSDQLEPPTTGSIVLIITTPIATPPAETAPVTVRAAADSATAAATSDSAPRTDDAQATSSGVVPLFGAAGYTSARARVTGPTSKTVDLTLSAGFWEGTVDGLAPGTYTVTVEGLIDGEIVATGTTTGVSVTAGGETPATVSLTNFIPTLTLGIASPTTSLVLPVTVGSVTGADGYRLEWANNPTFTSPSTKNVSGGASSVSVTVIGTWYIRARAVSGTTAGAASTAVSAEVLGDQTQSGADAASAPVLGFGTGANGTLTQLNITPASDQDWFAVDACNLDTVTVETFAARLTPPSELNSYLRLFASDGTTLVAENDDINATLKDSRLFKIPLPGDDRYKLQVTSASSATVGQYELAITVLAGPNNRGTVCAPNSVLVTPADTTLVFLGQTVQMSAVALDGDGAPIPGVTFTWASDNTAVATVDPSTGLVTAVANGVANISATGLGVTGSTSVTVGQVVTDVVVSPATASIAPGATQQFTAAGSDAGGSPVSGVRYLWVSSNSNVAVVDTTGLARGMGGGTAIISAVGQGEPGNAVLTVTGTPLGAATLLAFSAQPTTATAGSDFSPAVEVEVRDAYGNLITDARNAVTLAIANNPGGASLYGTKTVNANGGVAKFTGLWMDKAAAGYTLTATSASLNSATSSTFSIMPGAPARLAFGQQPSNVEGNVVMAPAVTVTIADAFGNVATSATGAVTLGFGVNVWKSVFAQGAALLGTTTVNAVGGVATFSNLRVDKPGNGYTLDASATGLTGAASNPFGVDLTVQSVSAAGSSTCAVTSSGTYCWGFGGSGQLGDGTFDSDSVARLVSGGALTFAQVSIGRRHACGLTGGQAYCWGANFRGQLGDNSTTSTNVPVAVSGGLTFSSISVADLHTCGVAGTALYCWGADGNGQLGDDATLADKLVPTQVSAGLSWAAVSAGSRHTCGRTTGGDAYCWGYDGFGQLGNDAPFTQQPTPVVVAGGNTWAQVSTGTYHTCGVTDAGAGYCWGNNWYGKLGADTLMIAENVHQGTPVVVYGGLTWSVIRPGGDHTCGLTTTGTAYCWGNGVDGELGDGTSGGYKRVRTLVSGGLTFSALSLGANGYHTCGRVATQVWCWGWNGNGQLGDGSQTMRTEPVQIVQ